MPMIEATDDTMSDRLEEAIRDLLLALPEWANMQVVLRGDPGDLMPTRLYPFGIVFLTDEADPMGDEGYTDDTGPMRSWRYDGYIECSVLIPDAASLVPDDNRKADVASYIAVKRYAKAAQQALWNWGPEPGDISGIVMSEDGLERSSSVEIDRIQTGLTSRGRDNVANIAIVTFNVKTRRQFT